MFVKCLLWQEIKPRKLYLLTASTFEYTMANSYDPNDKGISNHGFVNHLPPSPTNVCNTNVAVGTYHLFELNT